MPSCFAVNCSNSVRKGFKVHRFPSDLTRRTQWAINVNRTDDSGKLLIPKPTSTLCEEHFSESQYEIYRSDGLRRLKYNAKPTIFKHRKEIKERRVIGSQKILAEPRSQTSTSIIKSDHIYCMNEENSGISTNCPAPPSSNDTGTAVVFMPQLLCEDSVNERSEMTAMEEKEIVKHLISDYRPYYKLKRYCIALSCDSIHTSNGMSFFSVPKDKARAKTWLENVGRQDLLHIHHSLLRNRYVCALHFEDKCFMNASKNRLVWDAAPRKGQVTCISTINSNSELEEYLLDPVNCDGDSTSSPELEHNVVFITVDGKEIHEVVQHFPEEIQQYEKVSPHEVAQHIHNLGKLPQLWCVSPLRGMTRLMKVSDTVQALTQIVLILHEDWSIQILVHGHNIPEKHSVWSYIPRKVTPSHHTEHIAQTLIDCVCILSEYKICCGNYEDKYVSQSTYEDSEYLEGDFNEKDDYGYYTKTVRTNSCSFLTDKTRCMQCQLYRKSIQRSLLSDEHPQGEQGCTGIRPAKRPHCSLTEAELRETIK